MDDDSKELIRAAAEAAMKPVADLFEKLIGAPAEQIGGMWTDALKVRRFGRLIKLGKRVKAMLDDAGLEAKHVPDNVSIPLLNAATLNDSESLQEKWAALLANATNPFVGVHPGFVQILANMLPLDAVVMDLVYKKLFATFLQTGNFQLVYITHDDRQEVLRLAFENGGEVSFENLVRLGLLMTDLEHSAVRTSEGKMLRPTYRYYMTALGRDFYRACQPPANQPTLP